MIQSLTADMEIGLVTDGILWDCPEDPEQLVGAPIGMYHCPWCGCMQIAGFPHIHEVECYLGLDFVDASRRPE